MRRALAIVAMAGLAIAPAAVAQVTVNPGALDTLSRPAAPARRPPARAQAHPAPHAPAARPGPAHAPAAAAAPARVPAVPTVPPAILALPPPVAVPLAHPPPPPPIPTAADAPGAATPIPGGVRVTFGPDRADLNPTTEAALRGFARGVKGNEQTRINIAAYAAGNADDPSTPRRLALSRALAARAVLMDEGIASPRIYPRALGPEAGDAAPDRIDVVAAAAGATPAAATPPAPQGPAR